MSDHESCAMKLMAMCIVKGTHKERILRNSGTTSPVMPRHKPVIHTNTTLESYVRCYQTAMCPLLRALMSLDKLP